MKDFLIGALGGYSKAQEAENKSLLDNEISRRKQLSEFWKSQVEDPNVRPEARDVAMQKFHTILQTPVEKKLPKGIEGLDDYLAVNLKLGQSVQKPPTEALPGVPSPHGSALPNVVEPIAPPQISQEQINQWAPSPPRFTFDEQREMGRQIESQKATQAVDTATRVAQAEAEIKNRYAPKQYRAFGPESSGLYEETSGAIAREPTARTLKEPTEKSLQPKEMRMKSGNHEMLLFNPDPENPGYFRKDPKTKALIDVTEDVAGEYHERQPPAALQILNATVAGDMDENTREALERATLDLSPANQLSIYAKVKGMLQRGNTAGARDTIRQTALQSEPADVRAKVRGRRTAMTSLTAIEALLKTVPTGLIAGSIEDTAQKLGKTGDPKYVNLAQRLRLANQQYRQSMSGLAFSDKESEQYAAVFPSYKNSAPYNTALIGSLRDAFANDDKVFWDSKLPPGWSDADTPSRLAPGGPPGGDMGGGTVVMEFTVSGKKQRMNIPADKVKDFPEGRVVKQ